MTANFTGVIPATVSPCDDDDRFLEDVFVEQIDRIYKAGVQGVYVCGGTGDALRMQNDDRKRALELAIAASKPYDGTVIAQELVQAGREV